MAFGDPGLLADSLLPNYSEIQKKYSLGIVCHYKDATPEIMSLISKKFVDVKFIDIFSEPFEFMKKINSCELVLSSSLHGLVTADAFGIPNAWLKLSDTLKGGNFKFEDYYSTFDIYPSPLNIEMLNLSTLSKIKDQYQRNNISAIKKELISSFPHNLYK